MIDPSCAKPSRRWAIGRAFRDRAVESDRTSATPPSR